PAAGQQWRDARGVAEAIAPRDQAGLDDKRGGFEVVAVGPLGSSQVVPSLVHRGGRYFERRRKQRKGLPRYKREGFDLLADAGHAGPTSSQAERHVRAQRGRQ